MTSTIDACLSLVWGRTAVGACDSAGRVLHQESGVLGLPLMRQAGRLHDWMTN